jgi:hypothetical protein
MLANIQYLRPWISEIKQCQLYYITLQVLQLFIYSYLKPRLSSHSKAMLNMDSGQSNYASRKINHVEFYMFCFPMVHFFLSTYIFFASKILFIIFFINSTFYVFLCIFP